MVKRKLQKWMHFYPILEKKNTNKYPSFHRPNEVARKVDMPHSESDYLWKMG